MRGLHSIKYPFKNGQVIRNGAALYNQNSVALIWNFADILIIDIKNTFPS